jgi:predicted cation transporter
MSDHLITSVVTVLTAIIGVALIAVLVSSNSRTANVLSASSGAFSTSLGAALSPVTGSGLGLGVFPFSGGGAA